MLPTLRAHMKLIFLHIVNPTFEREESAYLCGPLEAQESFSRPTVHSIYIAIDDNVARTRVRVNASLAQFYGTAGLPGLPELSLLATYGPPEACIKGLREVAQAGAELIQLNLLFDDARQMERLVCEVLPYV